MIVTIKATCGNKNHIGNNWSQEYFINGKKIKSGSKVTFTTGEEIEFASTIAENDKYPDEGYEYTSRVISEEDLKKGFKIE